MIENRFIELMNGEIDGVNTPEESAALRAHLESSEEAKRYFEELRGIAGLFAAAGEINAPGGLERTIMTSIREREALEENRRETTGLGRLFAPRKKLACAFAAGIVFCLIALIILFNTVPKTGGLDREDLYGTLTGRRDASAIIAADSVLLRADGAAGRIVAEYRSSSLALIFDLETSREIEITLSADRRLMVESFDAPGCGAFDIHTGGNAVTIETSGLCRFAIMFRSEGGARPAVGIAITDGGTRIFEHAIAVDHESGRIEK